MSLLSPNRRRAVVPLYSVSGLAAAAGPGSGSGTLAQVVDLNPLSYPYFCVMVRGDAIHTYAVTLAFRTVAATLALGATAPSFDVTEFEDDGGLRKITDWLEARSDRVIIYIKNLDQSSAHTYDVVVNGIG